MTCMSSANSDLWAEYFRLKGDRAVTLRKVRSHQASHVGVTIEPWEFLCNAMADGMAERAAHELQLPQSVVDEVVKVDRKTELVLKRLLAVTLFQAQNKPKFLPPKVAGQSVSFGPRLPSRKELRERALAQGHVLHDDSHIVKCRLCHCSAEWKGARNVQWVGLPCLPGGPPNLRHPSHDVRRADSVWACISCGVRSGGLRISKGMADVCTGNLTKSGLAWLKWKGLKPIARARNARQG